LRARKLVMQVFAEKEREKASDAILFGRLDCWCFCCSAFFSMFDIVSSSECFASILLK